MVYLHFPNQGPSTAGYADIATNTIMNATINSSGIDAKFMYLFIAPTP
jgi:hypothetical protein